MDRPEILGKILDKSMELNAHARAGSPGEKLRGMVRDVPLFTSVTA